MDKTAVIYSYNELLLSNKQEQIIGLPRWTSGEESTCQCMRCKRLRLDLWVGKIPWRRKWQPTPLFLSGKSGGQRSLAGYSPWGHRELGMTEHTHTHTQIIDICNHMDVHQKHLAERSQPFLPKKHIYDNMIACIWIIKISQTSL